MKPITRSHEDAIPGPYIPDLARPVAVGSKYRANQETAYCVFNCDRCDRRRGTRCWQRRAEATCVYRIRGLLHRDLRLGRAFLVTLVQPTEWQFRAFTLGGPSSRKPQAKWHEVTGIVWEAELGEQIVD